jgi:hypothetical protein
MPTSISLIRHAEKQLADQPPYSVSVDGVLDPESLTPRAGSEPGHSSVCSFPGRTSPAG